MKDRNPLSRQLFICSVLFTLTISGLIFTRGPQARAAAALSKDQKVLHVLNRLGFGPSPGEVEKVRKMGIEKYIELQLNPEKIDDSALEAKLRRIEVTRMTTDQIFAKYPNPGAILRMLQDGRDGAPPAQPQNGDSDEAANAERRARREKLQKIYAERGLRPANRIMLEVQTARILRAVYSERQLQEVMVDFWANHFNVYSGKAATRWYIPSYERDVIRKNALGNFRDLLLGTAMHPAMLFYLDNFQSVAPRNANQASNNNRLQRMLRNGKLDPRIRERLRQRGLTDEQIDRRIEVAKGNGGQQNRRGINENYARELMELHTLGVDGGYTQKDIQEVARAFTGWTIFDPRGFGGAAASVNGGDYGLRNQRQARLLGVPADTKPGSFVFVERLHDEGVKTVLGQKIHEGGIKDGEKVLDILVSNPATAKFIAKKLAVKFVSDNPSDGLVSRVAKAFSDSKGDIKTALRALFSDPEFFAPENYHAKIKTPFELMVSALRALDVKTEGSRALIGMLRQMGEPLYGYQAPTGYPDTAADWVNTGALLERMNFAVALASGMVPQTRVDLARFSAPDKRQILDKAIDGLLSGEIAGSTRSLLEKQMDQPLPAVKLPQRQAMDLPMDQDAMDAPEGVQRRRQIAAARLSAPRGDPEVFKAVGLILGSPEFQRQ